MKLTDLQKEISGDWKAKGYELPEYDREAVKKNTKENPVWVHFGAGNIFRAFPAEILQRLLNSGAYDKGVIVAESQFQKTFPGSLIFLNLRHCRLQVLPLLRRATVFMTEREIFFRW